MIQYLFDPGYGKHISSLIFSLEDIYANINKFKNFKQKKFQFNRYYPLILRLLERNTQFYLGCLLWAVFLKTEPEGEIIGNYCFGKEYDEKNSIIELVFLMEYVKRLPKDTQYYLNMDFQYPDEFYQMLEIYKKFTQLNKGFTELKNNKEIILPDEIIIPTQKKLTKIKRTIDEVVQSGNLDLLEELRGYIIK